MSRHTWRRATAAALTASALVGGLAAGIALPTAAAEPADPTSEQQRPVSPDQILMMISEQYQTGRGGGQVSKLIEQVMTLRMRGFRPSISNAQALAAALDKRPNQGPLIEALQATLSYQRKQLAQSGIGAAPSGAPPVATPGSPGAPVWAPGNPMVRDDAIFPMPGR
ncbi:hypothetical protein JDV09_19615 [Mycobacterium sp. Y57]|uniref:hypothetical protein n=1 Tax=Mycolicibacterium xanthum TaxID=2796469 RepID=UPI001C84BD07|nr:hypothetical protein [Mycolicibacterium xanthum]MBX7434290.1 hypothetical protein [Mycolicibacterium xanthum]